MQCTENTIIGDGYGLTDEEGSWFENLVQILQGIRKLRAARERAKAEGQPVINLSFLEDSNSIQTR